jgi:hypothetical protein
LENKKELVLSPWKKKQAAMLHYFVSQDYLIELHNMVSQLLNGNIEPLLVLAKAQGRDPLLTNAVWGTRNTSINWSNHAWPMLKDLQAFLAKGITLRSSEIFGKTSVYHCIRGMSEYSLDWATPGEEDLIRSSLDIIYRFASRLDDSVTLFENRVDDFYFAYCYGEFSVQHKRIPKFTVNPNIRGLTGELPPKMGIYICADDPNASLQFVWTRNGGAQLRKANTFNEIGLAALRYVGRRDLWFDKKKMLDFAMASAYRAQFMDSVMSSGKPLAKLAPSAVARSAFTKRSCEWLLLDVVPGEFEDLASLDANDENPETLLRAAIPAGKTCPETGFYFSPAIPTSRQLMSAGQIFPGVSTQYGNVYWQWDENQDR